MSLLANLVDINEQKCFIQTLKIFTFVTTHIENTTKKDDQKKCFMKSGIGGKGIMRVMNIQKSTFSYTIGLL